MKIFRWLKEYKKNIFLVLCLLIISALVEVNIPSFLSQMIDIGVTGDGIENFAHGYIYEYSPFNTQITFVLTKGLSMLALVLFGIATNITSTYIISKTVTNISDSMRVKVFSKVMDFRKTEISKFKISSLITRTSQDVNQVQNFYVVFLRLALYAPILAIGSVFKIISISASMSLIIFTGIVVSIMLLVIVILTVTPKMKYRQKLLDRQNSVFSSILKGNLDIRSMNSQSIEKGRYEIVNEDIRKTQSFIDYSFYLMFPTLFTVIEIMMVAIIFFGAYFIDRGNITIGNMLAFSQYASQVVIAFRMLMFFIVSVPRATVSDNRIDEVLIYSNKIVEEKNILADGGNLNKPYNSDSIVLEFRNVSFKFPEADEYSIKNLNFVLKKSEKLGIIGTIGSGKSTILDLILRIIEPSDGEIYLNGKNIKNYDREELYSNISFSPQDIVLFSGSIRDNIVYGNKDVDDAKIKQIIDIAMMENFTTAKLGGIDRKVSQNAKNFSGGQKQRMSIARALMKDTQIYIFDDSFSALDTKTERLLKEKLSNYLSEKSLIVVSSRISTIKEFDKILVLDDGVCIGYANHENLVENCRVYNELVESQKNTITDIAGEL